MLPIASRLMYVMPGKAVAAYNEEHRGKYLVSTDRVIGVELNGEALDDNLIAVRKAGTTHTVTVTVG